MLFLSSLLETLHTDRKTIQHIAYVKLLKYKTHESHSRRLKYIVTLGGAILYLGTRGPRFKTHPFLLRWILY